MGMINRRRAYGGKSLPYDAEVEYLRVVQDGTAPYVTIYNQPADGFLSLDITINSIGNVSNYPVAFNFEVYGVNADFESNRTMLYTHVSAMRLVFENGYTNYMFINQVTFPKHIEETMLKYHVKPNDYGSNKYVKIGGGLPCDYKAFKVYDLQGNCTLDLIPARVGTTGYLYDKVSGQLFGNQGTGSFILGPDKDSAVIITQQQHEMYGE